MLCIAYFCAAPPNPANGVVDCDNPSHTTTLVYGERCRYSCNVGYELSGDVERGCERSENMAGSQPSCQSKNERKFTELKADCFNF